MKASKTKNRFQTGFQQLKTKRPVLTSLYYMLCCSMTLNGALMPCSCA